MSDEVAFREAVLLHAKEGSARLAPLMEAAGFGPPAFEVARGSGGPAAVARWRRADGMSVETHVRGSLGIVRYCCGDAAMTHQDYLRARGRRGEYPGYSDSPGDAFRHLALDLQGVAADVLTLTAQEFAAVAAEAAASPKPRLP